MKRVIFVTIGKMIVISHDCLSTKKLRTFHNPMYVVLFCGVEVKYKSIILVKVILISYFGKNNLIVLRNVLLFGM